MHPLFFKLLSKVERSAAYAQGKGYIAGSTYQEVRMLQNFLKTEPKLAIDIGGHVGNYATELRKKNPKLEIHIFEPSEQNSKKLEARFNSDTLINVIPVAVSDSTGETVLFSNELGSSMGSLTKRRLDHFNIHYDTKEVIKTIRFQDYWLEQLNSREIDLIKIDTEGHELRVLNGFGKALEAVKVFQFEFGGTDIDTRTFFQDFWYLFRDLGFDLYRATPFGPLKITRYSESEEYFTFVANYYAVNKAHQ